ncbi:MAG: fasciclin domain-containing protein [Cyanobacteriota bacterium]|nr:fasciclin domain-containing protein [Cyanobacteriota bacterium]
MKSSISLKFSHRFVGLIAASIVLPVAIGCSNQADDTATDAPAEPEVAEEVTEAPEVPAEPEEQAADPATEGGTIVDVAAANGSFETLVAAVQAAGLAETLSGDGPFTVFAPTDEAFAALPEGVLDALLLPENQEALTQILTYHVVPAEVPASDVATGTVASVAGEDLNLVADPNGVTVNEATVVQPDVEASNGVIHVIDAVLLPPSVDPAAL